MIAHGRAGDARMTRLPAEPFSIVWLQLAICSQVLSPAPKNKMRSARKNGTKKRRDRSATGQSVQIGTRWPEATIGAIDAWIARQDDSLGRSEAIRRLVEIGLSIRGRSRQESAARADRANELASRTIDSLTAGAADNSERADRKGRLIKGPDEFQGVRIDRPKRK